MKEYIKRIQSQLNLNAKDIEILERDLTEYDMEDISDDDLVEIADDILWMNEKATPSLTSKILG